MDERNVLNNLDYYIMKKIDIENYKSDIKMTKKDVIQDIADYCNVGWENINKVKRNVIVPSLRVALCIAEYFQVSVEDIFQLHE